MGDAGPGQTAPIGEGRLNRQDASDWLGLEGYARLKPTWGTSNKAIIRYNHVGTRAPWRRGSSAADTSGRPTDVLSQCLTWMIRAALTAGSATAKDRGVYMLGQETADARQDDAGAPRRGSDLHPPQKLARLERGRAGSTAPLVRQQTHRLLLPQADRRTAPPLAGP